MQQIPTLILAALAHRSRQTTDRPVRLPSLARELIKSQAYNRKIRLASNPVLKQCRSITSGLMETENEHSTHPRAGQVKRLPVDAAGTGHRRNGDDRQPAVRMD